MTSLSIRIVSYIRPCTVSRPSRHLRTTPRASDNHGPWSYPHATPTHHTPTRTHTQTHLTQTPKLTPTQPTQHTLPQHNTSQHTPYTNTIHTNTSHSNTPDLNTTDPNTFDLNTKPNTNQTRNPGAGDKSTRTPAHEGSTAEVTRETIHEKKRRPGKSGGEDETTGEAPRGKGREGGPHNKRREQIQRRGTFSRRQYRTRYKQH